MLGVNRKICVFTGTRAEYGLLVPLLHAINGQPDLALQVLVSGAHLSEEFGLTYQEIEKDGFVIDQKVEIPIDTATGVGISRSIGVGVERYAEALEKMDLDALVVLGDRYESLAVTIAATTLKIPIVHLHGGELTFGSMDESFPHAITKMSHLHFTSTEDYRNRVVQLGEHPETVFNVGALGVENIRTLKLLSKEEIETSLGINLDKKNLLITYHPATLENSDTKGQVTILLDVLSQQEDTNFIFTKANADMDGQIINELVSSFVSEYSSNAFLFSSLGQLRYLSLMQYVDAMVGNSSSGIIEAASFKLPVVNIGSRQDGRIKPSNVINAEPEIDTIQGAIIKALSKEFVDSLRNLENPYGDGQASKKIVSELVKVDLEKILIKKFYDVPVRG